MLSLPSLISPLNITPPSLQKRARPLLGTVVEIAMCGVDETAFMRASNAAFSRIEAIHQLMSFHEHTSDLSAIARAKKNATFPISPDTWKTLALALDIEARSNGIFNPTIASELVKRGLLPAPASDGENHMPPQSSLKKSITLEENFHIHVRTPVWIDLGGIAKGYAVDAAVDALIAHEIPHGMVNAGGDLRVFGDIEQVVSVRIPHAPTTVLPIASLRNLGCATTARYYSSHVDGAIVGARSIAAAHYDSVSVMAPSCAVADALTKVVWLGDPHSPEIHKTLKHFKANAALINSAGIVHRL